MIGAQTELNHAEQKIARWIAATRQKTNVNNGVIEAKVGNQSAEETHRIGFGAELAFAKMFNCYPDFTTESRSGGSDCEIFGATIDVKTTTYGNGRLLCVLKKQEIASDFYALMICEWPVYRFAGFARAEQVFSADRLTNLGHGSTYAVEQSDLVEFVTQLDLL